MISKAFLVCVCINDGHLRNCWIIETFSKNIRYLVSQCHLNKMKDAKRFVTVENVATYWQFKYNVIGNSESNIVFSCKNLFHIHFHLYLLKMNVQILYHQTPLKRGFINLFYHFWYGLIFITISYSSSLVNLTTNKWTGSDYSKLWISDDLDISFFLIWYYDS